MGKWESCRGNWSLEGKLANTAMHTCHISAEFGEWHCTTGLEAKHFAAN